MINTYDIAIIGSGASGLSLLYAMHLQGILDDYHIALIEPEPKNTNDRTWCFWTDESDPAWQMFSPCRSHEWSHIEDGLNQAKALDPFRYVQIRSKDFYHFVNDALSRYSKLDRISDRVLQIRKGQIYTLDLAKGENIQVQTIFDSRPPKILDPELIWQSFVGYRIRSEQAQFNTENCRLMDFEVPQAAGLQFMYLLPTSEKEALVEFTRFGKAILNDAEAAPIISDYLQKMGIDSYEILEKEIDKIPMSLSLNSKQKWYERSCSYYSIGVRAGAVKASTGFAFKNIVAHSWAMAQALKQGSPLPTMGHSSAAWIYDELLLNLWQKKENVLPKIFRRLFKVHPIPRILRFLDEKSSAWEDFLIMYRMPWRPFFWSIARSIRKRYFYS